MCLLANAGFLIEDDVMFWNYWHLLHKPVNKNIDINFKSLSGSI